MIRYVLGLSLIMIAVCCARGQSFTLSGYVKDLKTGEVLIGSGVRVSSQGIGSITNNYGFYSLTCKPADSLIVTVSYVGYSDLHVVLPRSKSQRLDFSMSEDVAQLGEVVVKENVKDNVFSTQMSAINIPMRLVKTLPVLFGERDILKTVQTLPGVQGGQEGTTGFYVRGGNSDQNLVLLDDAPVYNPNHLFGLFSTFNTNALNQVKLIKGGFPAQYGGRLSSILDVTMRDGNNKKFSGQAGIGLISSNLTLEGPLKKGKGSFIVSGRRTYLDLLLKPFLPKKNQTNYVFYDLNAKLNYSLGQKDKVFVSAFTGSDDAQYTGVNSLNYGINFGNSTVTARWNHLFNQKLFVNTSVLINRYQLSLSTLQSGYNSQIYTGIRDYSFKSDWEYYLSPRHTLHLGGIATRHAFSPLSASSRIPKSGKIPPFPLDSIHRQLATETALYLNDDWNVSKRIAISVGLRMPSFFRGTTNYTRLEPRVSGRYVLSANSSLKASYTIMNQFLHLVPNSTASLPTDIWIASGATVLPQASQQFALGWFRNSADNMYEFSIEGYVKEMRNQVLFKEGTQLSTSSDIEQNLVFGNGKSAGLEFFVRKNTGHLTGWISYTLSKTTQKFDQLNKGLKFPFSYDRRHNLAVVGSYELSPKWTVSGNFTFYTGRPYTLPVGKVQIDEGSTLYNSIYSDYKSRNDYRLRAYHRLDVSVTYRKPKKWFKKQVDTEWVFSAYNIYSRLNPYFVYTTTDDFTRQPVAREVSLLPIIPSVSYQVTF